MFLLKNQIILASYLKYNVKSRGNVSPVFQFSHDIKNNNEILTKNIQ